MWSPALFYAKIKSDGLYVHGQLLNLPQPSVLGGYFPSKLTFALPPSVG